jgi:glutamate-5-semialdehyde dehydrogenase
MSSILELAKRAKAASRVLASLPRDEKDAALDRISAALSEHASEILAANAIDVVAAEDLVRRGELSASAVQRLQLSQTKLAQMRRHVEDVMLQPDPVGRELLRSERAEGLVLTKITCPIGVITAVIESRPDAIVQLSALALKSGNALVLKPGSEAKHTASILVELMRAAISASGNVTADALIPIFDREALHDLLQLDEYIDLVVPRGGQPLVDYVRTHSKIPVLSHADGVCHIYVDQYADLEMAKRLILNAKTQAPATCNAVETILIHETIAELFVPELLAQLRAAQVGIAGCRRVQALSVEPIAPVDDDGWHHEYGCMKVSCKIVEDIDAAMEHIEAHGSRHTDCIVTDDALIAEKFLNGVDSANVFHNVSTRYSDGYRYGFGAEFGISTGKLHDRGPVGLAGLVTHKYRLTGNGHIV